MLFLVPKTPLVIVVLLVAIFALLFHPVWNFWWVERSLKRRVAACLVLIGSLICLGAVSWPPGVTVSPGRVSFRGSVDRENYLFCVRNRGETDVYSVQLKLKMSHGAFFDDFSYDIPAASRRPIVDGSDVADIAAIRCLDSKDRPMAIFWVYRMEPGGVREISVTHAIKSSAAIDARVSYTTSPQPRINDPHKAYEKFRADEPMKCNGALGYWLDPTKPPRAIDLKVDVERHR